MEILITLAGANFRPKEAKDYIKDFLKPHMDVTLVRDRANPYDERAIQIHFTPDGTEYPPMFIGFVPKGDNLLLSQKMDWCAEHDVPFGYEAECTGFMGTLQPTFQITFDPRFDDVEEPNDADDYGSGASIYGKEPGDAS